MTLQNLLTEYEIELIITAVSAQEKKWRDISKRPIRGYGTAPEQAKKEERALLADDHQQLLDKIVSLTI